MCGRYASSSDASRIVDVFAVDEVSVDRLSGAQAGDGDRYLQPRYNIAPTDTVPVVLERAADDAVTRRLAGLQWGLVPSWSKDAAGSARLINARLETVGEKPSFRKALAARRCLLPADGYYEWYATQRREAGRQVKQPFFIHPADALAGGAPMAMAGLFEYWKDPNPAPGVDPWLVSCCIITMTASDELGRIHDRMPVQLPPSTWDAWLDPSASDPAAALDLLGAAQPPMIAYAVPRLVSNVRNDGPELIEPLPDAEEPQGT